MPQLSAPEKAPSSRPTLPLRVRVVAEGVETPAQLASLRAQRCDYAQGFLFARPLTPAAAELLERDTRW